MKASEVLDNLKRRFLNEPEYHQAVSEVLGTIEEAYNEHPEFEKSNLIERLCIPDRIFSFRVTWWMIRDRSKPTWDTVSSITMRSARIKVVSVSTLL